MNTKAATIIALAGALAFSGLAAWKGAHVATVVFAALGGILGAASTVLAAFGILPPKDAAYIDTLEQVVEQHAPIMAQKVIRK